MYHEGPALMTHDIQVASIIGLRLGEGPQPLVLLTATGRYKGGEECELSIVMPPELARSAGRFLLRGAEAAPKDVAAYLRGDISFERGRGGDN